MCSPPTAVESRILCNAKALTLIGRSTMEIGSVRFTCMALATAIAIAAAVQG